MAILYQQTDFSETVHLGPTDDELIVQGFYMDRQFTLDSVEIRCASVSIDTINDVQFKVDFRSGTWFPLIQQDPLDSSAWITDNNMIAGAYNTFTMNSLTFNPGWHWICLTTNRRVNLGSSFSISKITGLFPFKLIKIEHSTGYEQRDRQLTFKLNGSYIGDVSVSQQTETDQLVITTIRDET